MADEERRREAARPRPSEVEPPDPAAEIEESELEVDEDSIEFEELTTTSTLSEEPIPADEHLRDYEEHAEPEGVVDEEPGPPGTRRPPTRTCDLGRWFTEAATETDPRHRLDQEEEEAERPFDKEVEVRRRGPST